MLLCREDPAAWEPSRDTHESKVLRSLSSSKESESSLSLAPCNTAQEVTITYCKAVKDEKQKICELDDLK